MIKNILKYYVKTSLTLSSLMAILFGKHLLNGVCILVLFLLCVCVSEETLCIANRNACCLALILFSYWLVSKTEIYKHVLYDNVNVTELSFEPSPPPPTCQLSLALSLFCFD